MAPGKTLRDARPGVDERPHPCTVEQGGGPARYAGPVSKTFEELFAELHQIAATRPEGSGTIAKLDEGTHAIGKKIIEEAAEVWMAAEYQGRPQIAEEISQLLYWVQVLMLDREVKLEDVYAYL